MGRRIAFINEKGGSCKTTLAVNLGAFFAHYRRRRVLLVDMDPQGQVGKALGFEVKEMEETILSLLEDPGRPPRDVIRASRVPGLDVIVSNKRLAEYTSTAGSLADHPNRLARALEGIEGYDYVLFDSPPSLGVSITNIMIATEEMVIPVSLTYFALDGCAEILDSVARVRERYGHEKLRVSLVVPTLYRRTRLADAILDRLREHFPDNLSRTVIGYDVKIDEAQSHGKTIWEYAPTSRGAEMFTRLAMEVERWPTRL
ncbi:MAG: chromosome partitioning protein [Deltaproteobacteria bacterium RBG_13_65_10]|jgi:chromosome partitioning protein|nr:MAG: chromosome partitioning protein [Deltaproteobacteria bacterium RBG_13_65_10]